MPPQDLPPGLYDHPLSESALQALAQLLPELHQLSTLDPPRPPQRLARALRQLSAIALAALPEAEKQPWLLGLVNGLVALLQEQAPQAIQAGDRLHGSARLLQELREAALLPGQAPLRRPLIPLAAGAPLVNAPSEPRVGQALQAEIP